MIYTIFPTYIAMILAVNLFINSGALDLILNVIKSIISNDIIPAEIIPMSIVRPISGSASLAYLNNIYMTKGPDSFVGLLGSVIQGCTDTTFYVVSLYFASIGIRKTKYTLKAALFADFIGITASIIIVNLLFK